MHQGHLSGLKNACRWAYREDDEFPVEHPAEVDEIEKCGCLHLDPMACDRETPERPSPQVRFVSHDGSVTILIEE